MRNQLAAVDFNNHRGRPIAKTAEGKEKYIMQTNIQEIKINIQRIIHGRTEIPDLFRVLNVIYIYIYIYNYSLF